MGRKKKIEILPPNIWRDSDNKLWKKCKTCGTIAEYCNLNSALCLGNECCFCRTNKGVWYDPIKKIFCRRCPKCNSVVAYERKYLAYAAVKLNQLCKSCSSKNNKGLESMYGPTKPLPTWATYDPITHLYTITCPKCKRERKVKSITRKHCPSVLKRSKNLPVERSGFCKKCGNDPSNRI
jgi:hypothetical protein